MLKKVALLQQYQIPRLCYLQNSLTTFSRQCCLYATVHDRGGEYQQTHIPWSGSTVTGTIPTPYQIFGQRKGSPYSKRRFYELVKLYHPDRHGHNASVDGLSYATKLERYRLIIAANDLLSDPAKRSAYDCYGAGWNGQPGVHGTRDPLHAWDRGDGWSGPHGPSRNATWEDWEKWYQRDAQRPQEPVYLSNGAFVCLVLLFGVLGGIAHAARAGNYSMSYLKHQDALHNDISKELNRRRRETVTAYPSREERVRQFLRQRDQYALAEPLEEKPRNLPPPH